MHNAHCYKYTCVYLYKKKTHTGVHLNVKICVNTYACICKTTCNQTHLHWFINTYAYKHIYIYYVCIYVYYVYIYIYVYVAMLMYRHVNIVVHIYMYDHVCVCFLFMLSRVYIFECISIDTHSHKDHLRSICIWLHLHTVYIIHILHIQNTIHHRERGSLPLRLPRWCLPAANMSQWKKKHMFKGKKIRLIPSW